MERTMSNICRECGKTKEEHCVFVPITIPDGCKCNPKEWGDPSNIPSVCKGPFFGDEDDLCTTCQHMEECHHQ